MKKTTAERDPHTATKLRDLIEDIEVAMLTTVTADGALRSRPMATQEMREDGELWFFMSDDSGKAKDLSGEHAVNVSYSDPARHRYVSVTGNATVVHDRAKAKALWNDGVARFFPRGLDDPHLALLLVRVETAEFWDATAGRMKPLAEGAREAGARGHVDTEHTQIDIRATPTSG